VFPFGIQAKGFILGILFSFLVVPFVQRILMARKPSAPGA
jgi:hypothetical protein